MIRMPVRGNKNALQEIYCRKERLCWRFQYGINIHTHTHLTALCPGLPWWAGTRKIKPIWILLEQETVSGSGISWAICKCAPCSRQITMPAPHYSVFYRPDALPALKAKISVWEIPVPLWEHCMVWSALLAVCALWVLSSLTILVFLLLLWWL